VESNLSLDFRGILFLPVSLLTVRFSDRSGKYLRWKSFIRNRNLHITSAKLATLYVKCVFIYATGHFVDTKHHYQIKNHDRLSEDCFLNLNLPQNMNEVKHKKQGLAVDLMFHSDAFTVTKTKKGKVKVSLPELPSLLLSLWPPCSSQTRCQAKAWACPHISRIRTETF